MEATFCSLVPPLLAIIFALITKEVNLSLIIGVVVGCGIYCNFNLFDATTTMFDIMSAKVYGNMGVLIFIILLGMIVHLMNMSGATHEYAKWAGKRLKTKKQTLLATMLLGIIIFVDDYFNCLTVGTVMRPIADKNRISREKLAYVIDSTAAPICIIAPISSWAAAVSSSLPDGSSIDGFQLFMKTIFCNYYSWLSIGLIFLTVVFSVDFGKMREYEMRAAKENAAFTTSQETPDTGNGKVIDLLLPVVALIVLSIIAMLYTGGYFDGSVSIADAFANCDAILGLAMGAAYTVIFVAVLYLPRKIVSVQEFLDSLVQGFIHMVPAALILTFAWTLGGICGGNYLNAGGFVASMVEKHSIALNYLPALFFVVSLLLAFSTGTSWGTFAILLPITVSVFNDKLLPLTAITTAAVLGGAVCGDHISPISDTTILSSTGAGCTHINHVSSQMQYGLAVAAITAVSYIAGGLAESVSIGFITGFALLIGFVVILKSIDMRKNKVAI